MGKAGLLKKLHPLLVLTTIWAISDEQPPSVRYTRGYAELPTALHTFRTDNEASRVARIFRQEDHCSLLSRLSLCSQKDSKDDKCIGVIKRTLPLQKYEVRIHFYIHFTIAGSHARCPTISGNVRTKHVEETTGNSLKGSGHIMRLQLKSIKKRAL